MGNCLATVMSHIIYFSEKFTMCIAATSLITCIVFCMTCMLAFGVGLGYNYSFVDFKTKHKYVAAGYRTVRPTNYYGPGYFKPITNLPKHKKPKWARILRSDSPIVHSVNNRRIELPLPITPPGPVEIVPDPLVDWPTISPVDLIPLELQPTYDVKLITLNTIKTLEGLYFSTPRTKPRQFSFNSQPHYNSTTETMIDVSNNTEFDKYDGNQEINDASNDIGDNAKKYQSESESVAVNISKIHNDSAHPFVMKTKMHPKQLLEWLSRLRKENKTFALHVATD